MNTVSYSLYAGFSLSYRIFCVCVRPLCSLVLLRQRIIRTGRTGHWINHSKEHCLVGIKGNPKLQRNLDTDVLVSEVRETSRKPDEIYGLIERISPKGRKCEIFGRPHNVWPGWTTLGNQLPMTRMWERDTIERYNDRYPENPHRTLTASDFLKKLAKVRRGGGKGREGGGDEGEKREREESNPIVTVVIMRHSP